MPLLSVIIPAYNAEKTISTAIDSVLSQSFNDFELIVIDDGSVDNTPQIIDTYAANNSKIRPVHRTNGGQAVARNHGLSLASGQWVLFLDADDSYVPGAFEILMKNSLNNPDFILFGFNVFKKSKLLRTPNAGNVLVKCDDVVAFEKIRFLMSSACNKMYKRNYIKNLFDKGVVHGEDKRFNYQNLSKDTVILSIADCLYNVNLDNEESVNKRYKPGRFYDTVYNTLLEINTLKSFNLGSDLIKKVYKDGVGRIVACAAGCQNSCSKTDFISELKKSKDDIVALRQLNVSTAGLRIDYQIVFRFLHASTWGGYYAVYQYNILLRVLKWLKSLAYNTQ